MNTCRNVVGGYVCGRTAEHPLHRKPTWLNRNPYYHQFVPSEGQS